MSEGESRFLSCSACGQIIDASDFAAGESIACPHCQQAITIPEQSAEEDSSRYAELDGTKIQQIAKLRSATYRARSHLVIATLVCLVAVVESLAYLVRDLIHFGFTWRIFTTGGIAIAGILGVIFFFRRTMALHRELSQSIK
jgi:DNA-directed RNA polymerase subunit RPC12/RpoP/multidrug transporter EmrE-like cation transporter